MRFAVPHFPSEFEIPDDWLQEAGIAGFKPMELSYRSIRAATRVPLMAIEPIPRLVALDHRGFSRERMVRLLKGFVDGHEIEPVPPIELPILEFVPTPYRFLGSRRVP